MESVNGEVGALLEEIEALRARVAELERWNGAAERAAEDFASERNRAEEELLRANRRMRADLDAAAEVQESLLPTPSIEIPGLEVGWQVRPSERLGGDLLDLYRVDDEHVGMYVVDVSGHGVSAAMLSIAIQRVLSQSAVQAPMFNGNHGSDSHVAGGLTRPSEVCRRLNAMFPRNPITGQYCTLIYGVYNLRTHLFRFSSAGHSPPILVTPDGRARELVLPGAPIGLWPDAEFDEIEVAVPPGSRIYLYSDGILDVFGPEGDPYGAERLLGEASELRGHDVRTSVTRMIEGALAWNAGEVPLDDISMLAFEAGSRVD